jgi:cbb3-type cytochrome oxidase subunit 3
MYSSYCCTTSHFTPSHSQCFHNPQSSHCTHKSPSRSSSPQHVNTNRVVVDDVDDDCCFCLLLVFGLTEGLVIICECKQEQRWLQHTNGTTNDVRILRPVFVARVELWILMLTDCYVVALMRRKKRGKRDDEEGGSLLIDDDDDEADEEAAETCGGEVTLFAGMTY